MLLFGLNTVHFDLYSVPLCTVKVRFGATSVYYGIFALRTSPSTAYSTHLNIQGYTVTVQYGSIPQPFRVLFIRIGLTIERFGRLPVQGKPNSCTL